MAYDPRLITLVKMAGATMVGWTFRLGASRLGQTADTRTPIRVSAVTMTDGYDVGPSGELSIDPMTGTATISDEYDPDPGDLVTDDLGTVLAAGDRIQISYGNTVLQQGAVTSVDSHVETDGFHWIRKTTYQFTGSGGIMLANTIDWPALPQESALTRLGRFFTVDTSLLSIAQTNYLNSVMAASTGAGTGTYLDQARAFTAATLFPVRPANPAPVAWRQLAVVPAVTFQGTLPTPSIGSAENFSCSSDFTTGAGLAHRTIGLEVIKNFDGFITGVTTGPAAPLAALGQFQLGTSRIGKTMTTPIGIQAPAVIDAFGTRVVASKVIHNFNSRDYRSGLEVVAPVNVG
jgi:hypothetical protein